MTAPPEQAPPASVANALVGMRILVVEDIWIVAQSYVALLENLGVRVSGPAGTVIEAMSLIEAAQVDAALVDMNLHGEMAVGVVDALASKGVAVVIVTGFDVAQDVELKAAACLRKPVRAEALIKAFRNIGTGS